MPRVSIVVWQDPDAFEEEYGENAENVAGFLDPEDWEAHMLNVNRTLGLGTVHEFTHLVSLARNPEIPNNPKWLWEAVAIYESNRPPPPKPSTLSCITPTSIPTLDELDDHPVNIYRVGHLLAEFIVMTWSQQTLGELVATNGDVLSTLNVAPDEFEQMWLDYVNSGYDMPQSGGQGVTDC